MAIEFTQDEIRQAFNKLPPAKSDGQSYMINVNDKVFHFIARHPLNTHTRSLYFLEWKFTNCEESKNG